ncbi:AraC-like DNA-binding protein [Thermosporothrix hazakensis]|jgi:AraC-like DNA-binding protein|uniref:AraC-like DNA-binding protein n=1 Tax=Thermosporothrix hazakensis TaxID=644383 RepID=A0A326U262_THEHA|nr:AraC family transcriptional regulator [Thermosporothrix hazakensis]PZW24063.1 AraC-like DNA-binding protein [Thermosporothrix hazakensis]GCE50275.1 AraC family transcriptional regulator [Thermosporothrix hazakensis]
MDQLLQRLRRLQASQEGALYTPRYGAEVYGVALEKRTASDCYDWDGRKRGGDAAHPFVVFQYTLAGQGCYAEGQTVTRILPQTVFLAVVPSDSRYYLPPDSPEWVFCWLIIRHPYVVQRLMQRIASVGPIMQLDPSSMVLARVVQLLEGIYDGTFHDVFAEELALFHFLIEYERLAHSLSYAPDVREQLLQNVRSYVLQTLWKPIEVEQLARRYGMSRSHFSHYFKRNTGLSPAQFVMQVRLEEATQRLLQSDLTLEVIARETGFANANHFCKVFRRHMYLSPGEFRRQMRPFSRPGSRP